MTPNTLAFLTRLSRSPDAQEAAIADNGRYDERAAEQRWKKFEDKLPDPAAISLGDWGEANALNFENTVAVSSLTVPDVFLDINQPAWLTAIAENRSVVRLESIQRALGGDGGVADFDKLRDLLAWADSGSKDAVSAVETFFQAWNQRRDGRPAFATFYDEVKTEADAADWPHALRDRLGLGHYGRDTGARLPVALMRYSLEEVFATQKSRKLPAACALPTVLDGGMHEFFFPVPKQHPYGTTLHLQPGQAGILTAEILHCRIDYQHKHLWKLGWIERAHSIRDDALREARDLHLLSLRDDCGRADFAEEMRNRS